MTKIGVGSFRYNFKVALALLTHELGHNLDMM